MKFTKFKNLAAIPVAGLFVLAAAPAARAQVTTTIIKSAITNVITCASVTTNLAVGVLVTNTFTPGKHLGVGVVFVGQDATNTGTLGLRFNVVYGGTNNVKSTTTPFTATYTANGTTAVRDWYVIPDYTLGPCPGLVLGTITNALANVGGTAGSVIVSNVWLEYR